ncbi:MAG: hypothetical protein JXD18_15080 [Anaerolineae bacterium]|nr:hypothetical protein [Anaerolineae bacterium]
MSKHTGYYELRDALQEPGCAICRLGKKVVTHYLDGLIYANANDYQVRAEVKLARGFCNLHAWQLRDCHGAGLDMAILSADVLVEWLQALQGFTPQAPPPNLFQRLRIALGLGGGQPDAITLAETLAPQRPCLACQTRDEAESASIHELLIHLEDPEVQAGFVQSGGLCLAHFRQTLKLVTQPAQVAAVVRRQETALLPLLEQLREFIRKHDYRFQDEMTAADGAAWIRALEAVSGRRGTR